MKLSKIIPIILYVIAIVLYFIMDIDIMRLFVYVVMIINVVPKIRNVKRNFLFLSFHFTFFLFLLGSDFASFFSVDKELKINVLDQFSEQTRFHVYFLLALSLISVEMGYNFKQLSKNTGITCDFSKIRTPYVYRIQNISKKMMYLFSLFAIATEMEKCIFVQTIGYVDYYLTYNSHMPMVIVKLGTFYTTSFFIYLATLPSKKHAKKSLLLFLFIGILSLGYGQRNGAMLSIIIVLFYLNFREIISNGTERWISKRLKYVIVCSFPVLILFLYAFNSIRNDMVATTYTNTIDNFLAFFSQQGGSVQIIGMQKDFANANLIPEAKYYSFGTLIDFFQQNAFAKLLGTSPSYEPKSYELAMYGHHFGETMTYLYRPDLYASGFGLGSCYIAEIFNDFGFWGVISLNFLYGLIFKISNYIKITSIWKIFALLVVVKYIIYAPRSGAMDFLTSFFTFSVTGFAFLLHLYAKIKE